MSVATENYSFLTNLDHVSKSKSAKKTEGSERKISSLDSKPLNDKILISNFSRNIDRVNVTRNLSYTIHSESESASVSRKQSLRVTETVKKLEPSKTNEERVKVNMRMEGRLEKPPISNKRRHKQKVSVSVERSQEFLDSKIIPPSIPSSLTQDNPSSRELSLASKPSKPNSKFFDSQKNENGNEYFLNQKEIKKNHFSHQNLVESYEDITNVMLPQSLETVTESCEESQRKSSILSINLDPKNFDEKIDFYYSKEEIDGDKEMIMVDKREMEATKKAIADVKNLKREVEKFVQEKKELEFLNGELEDKVDSLMNEKKSNEGEINEMENLKNSLENKLKIYIENIRLLEDKLKESDEKLRETGNELKEVEEENSRRMEDLQTENTALKKKIEGLQERENHTSASLEKELEGLKAKYDLICEQKSELENRRLEDRLSSQISIKDVQKTYEQTINDLKNSLKGKLDFCSGNYKIKISELKTDLERQEDLVIIKQRKIEDLESFIDELEDKLKNKDEKIEELSSEKQTSNNQKECQKCNNSKKDIEKIKVQLE